ncbi:ribosome recycling factor [Rubrobacter taiwanensis]|jgi:ribosome recycling factor|uniref:Ribosome-recycling factor n=1 Tax=Rubrobacter taiwanensis TaxID=185139 RepID=A0A4R1BHB9_9ACTN|nr:ribosome recycling factor [Rubrobacter taiwanensis]TCJ16640.1 ribosome recycling factor [Rubrobacter taiwanensis]
MTDVVDLSGAEARMKKSVEAVRREFATVRTGRANPAILDRIEVEAYGSRMPLRSVAGINVPEARLITVTPFDPNTIKAIEKAIRESDIGLNPQSDGKVIRLPIPELTEERRRELIRVVRGMAEEGRVSIRNIRRAEMREIGEWRREGEISEDDERRVEEELQRLTDRYIGQIDAMLRDKEAELMEV